MSREMKLRAWDRLRKQMCNVICLNCHRNDEHILQRAKPIPCVENPCYNIDADSIDLMQYTGLKDRKGVEICEGDIIVSEGVCQPCSTKLEGPEPYRDIGDVKWSDIYLGWFFMGDSLADLDPNECKIIGNVHENPELLEEGK